MDELKAKQQVVAKIKESEKILVTVSDDPSVDALSAALALTLLLDKQKKYATAIFSGETPPAIAFLEPEKTFDDTTDSLRDFIIALNKEKADHLRYKVEGESVKIFITPYKTTIDQSDLEFSQGDYNVELVIALGVDNQKNLDKALENHGQILHDASIITMTAGEQTSDLGGTDWHDSNASSLSEMVAGLAESLKDDKKKSLLDTPIATALLTGIVAQTDRFSNEHTTSKVMTISATLMAAGADQQLISNELQTAQKIEVTSGDDPDETSGDSPNDSDVEIDNSANDGSLTIKKDKDPSALEITHEGESLADLDRRVRGNDKALEKVAEEVEAAQEDARQEEAKEAAEAALEAATEKANDTVVDDTTPQIGPSIATPQPEPGIEDVESRDDTTEPTLGGTLNATTEQAADDARREIENDQNKTILSHSYLGGSDDEATPGSALVSTSEADIGPSSHEPMHSAYAVEDEPAPTANTIPQDTPADQSIVQPVGGERVIQPLNEAPLAPPTPDVAPNPGPADLGLPLPPPVPDFSQFNTGAPAPAIPLPPTEPPAILGDILAPEPTPAFTDTSNAVPAPNTAYAYTPEPVEPVASQQPMQPPQPVAQPFVPQPPAPQNTPADPGQFQIPAQP